MVEQREAIIKRLCEEARRLFAADASETWEGYFSPGRVNLIGEHTDYNGGYVFPCALSFGTYAVLKRRKDKCCRMYSNNFKELGMFEISLENIVYEEKHAWTNYPKGVIKMFQDMGVNTSFGFDILLEGNIPNGAGLSSSASIELLIAEIVKDLYQVDIDRISMVKLCQRSENVFNKVNCGIMDQFAIGMGKKDHAILLDCNNLDYQYVPLVLEEASIVIANTNKKRGLADSKYNERRASCEAAVADLQRAGLSIQYLGELSVKEFEEKKALIQGEEKRKRARHAVTENERTKAAVEKLNQKDVIAFGKLMNESHLSLRDDYEVTGFELDSLVEAAWEEEGCLGSRMTGAGFGGCTVSIVTNREVEHFIQNVGKKYTAKTGLQADFYIAKIGDGTRKLGDF
ncbi:galactokinase [Fusobacterium necrophorum subsp. funduliforme ATCC 51357]|nr:galactokinase [Fusobacterium necrophorum]AYV93190.1 galactokinase [Fusobacterium necrophorum subsp. funduliforme]EIJ70060.1 galactokinase [Fusobacterium necrophorum subsp. funduliforme ATCC 51357]KAB0554329.1 galactokinase [Fusobacterium necrophorum subsp. funduliforme]MDK4487078.1 galactokinase [Fusobacterium necrophorum]MDK4489128.1 galactokinase [Fusobacterium necrophorum]